MKKNLIKFSKVAWLMVMAFALITTSCKKDDDDDDGGGDDPVIVLDGVYIKGAGTALADYDTKGMMKVTRNEVTQEDRASLLELYIAVKGGADGFNIVTVEGATKTIYGPGADFAEVTEPDGDEPTLGLKRGSVAVTDTKFTVDADGLYHVAYDTEIGIVTIAKVEWGVIGAATPGGWGESTQLASEGFDLNTMTFTAVDITLTKGDYKFRYSNGWKVILDSEFDLGDGNTGIKVNANYGGTVEALVPGGANITNETPGYYTATITWVLGSGYSASVVKTGDLETYDYSATELGLIGDGIMNADTVLGWNYSLGLHAPTVTDETTYTWLYEGISVTSAGSFKIREGQDWNGKSIGYADLTMGGTAAANFQGTDPDGNIQAIEDGIFDFELIIDAVTETYTFNVNPAGVSFNILYVPGAHQEWDPSNESTVVYDGIGDGNYEGYLYFPEAANEFKITNGPTWDENYGDDGADGTLEQDGANIVAGDAGYYKLNVDFNALTYTALLTNWGLIGDATGSWDDDQDMTYDADNDVWTITTDLVTGEVKFRANDAWDINYGDDSGNLVQDGANIAIAEDGNYTITMNLGTPPYAYEVVKN